VVSEPPGLLAADDQRSSRYLHFIIVELDKRGMPLEIALLPMVESAYNPTAYSRSHASGLWQFVPATGKQYKLEQNWWVDERRDIVAVDRRGARLPAVHLRSARRLAPGAGLLQLGRRRGRSGDQEKRRARVCRPIT
jgi:hypothetical protein